MSTRNESFSEESSGALAVQEQQYRQGLVVIQKDYENLGDERLKDLVVSGAMALRHFFDKGEYGDPSPDNLPVYWSYVRFLAWDILRPRFSQGESEYGNHNYGNKFMQDITDEANEIVKILPGDLSHAEWLFLVRVRSHMLILNPLLVREGFVTPAGRENLVSHALLVGPSDDIYHKRLKVWREKYSTGMREI